MFQKESSYTLLLLLGISNISCTQSESGRKAENERPNILWITTEDISPYLGCYGHIHAQTPNLDQLAERGIRYTRAYANAPVCAPSRATLLTGMYATTAGSHEMRSEYLVPAEIPAYPKILREAGYYCTNNSKKDYNSSYSADTTLWDSSGRDAHYRNRKSGQPFFAVFNIMETHESQIGEDRIKYYTENGLIPAKPRVNPEEIKLPPYHPDLPEVREDWARLHDLITLMDKMVGDILKELEEEGLADNTIIFFYSDHGGQLARSKHYIYNTGTQVPFILYLPQRWQHVSSKKPGDTDDRLVSFVDFPKTVLSLTNCSTPDIMQGRVFLGKDQEAGPEFVHLYRGRVSERWDSYRAVTDGRYYFIQNFMPHRPVGRQIRYSYLQANWRALEREYENGGLNELQSKLFLPKPPFELFDTQEDPWHVNNLAGSSEYNEILTKFSNELDQWMIQTRDIGLIPEPMFQDLSGKDKPFKTMYGYAQSEEYEIERIHDAAKVSVKGDQKSIANYLAFMQDSNPVIRYWGAYGIFLARPGSNQIQEPLRKMIREDAFPANRLMAAQALGITGNTQDAFNAIMKELLNTKRVIVFLFGLNALQYGHADSLMTLNDWKKLKEITFPDEPDAIFGFHTRIIDDAIDLWPSRRVVD